MVHPFIRRRNGEEEVSFPSDELGRCWPRRWACRCSRNRRCRSPSSARASPPKRPTACAGRSPPSRSTAVSDFRTRFLRGMRANGYDEDFAERCFSQIEGFGSYGFPESHAASFALLVYASSWLKRHHPGIFACALLNSQPMGFYAPAQIVRDAREHGVEVRPVCINRSHWDNVMERTETGGPGPAPRLPADQVHAGGGGRLDRRRPRQRLHGGGGCLAPRGSGGAHADHPGRGRRLRRAGPDPARGALGRPRAGAEGGTAAFRGRSRRRGDRGGRRDPAPDDRGRGGGGGLRRHAPDAQDPSRGADPASAEPGDRQAERGGWNHGNPSARRARAASQARTSRAAGPRSSSRAPVPR
jgi:hypothetical protein